MAYKLQNARAGNTAGKAAELAEALKRLLKPPVIDRLAANAPLSLRAMKALMVRQMEFRDAIAHADIDALVAAASASADAREGIAAMLERRAPSFQGR